MPKKTAVASTILSQLGGGKFVAMTGAKDFLGGSNSLAFRLPRGLTKRFISHVKITLDPDDTYTMSFKDVRGTKIRDVAEFKGVYWDNMASIFEETTGLITKL